jgi:hypothetical protein
MKKPRRWRGFSTFQKQRICSKLSKMVSLCFDFAPFDFAPFDFAPFDFAPFDFAPFDFAQGG